MRLTNIKELQARAEWHRKLGHVAQGTYGNGTVNGKATFEGCAVGCLSTPHTTNRLIKFLREHLTPSGGLDWEGREQREALTRDFGLEPRLISVVEALFEAQSTHGAAIEFVPNFTNALTEGADIDDEDVDNWLANQGLPLGDWNEIHDQLEYEDEDYVEDTTSEFLEFVGSFKPGRKEAVV